MYLYCQGRKARKNSLQYKSPVKKITPPPTPILPSPTASPPPPVIVVEEPEAKLPETTESQDGTVDEPANELPAEAEPAQPQALEEPPASEPVE